MRQRMLMSLSLASACDKHTVSLENSSKRAKLRGIGSLTAWLQQVAVGPQGSGARKILDIAQGRGC